MNNPAFNQEIIKMPRNKFKVQKVQLLNAHAEYTALLQSFDMEDIDNIQKIMKLSEHYTTLVKRQANFTNYLNELAASHDKTNN